ncbi:MAG: hypothetical protein KGL69_01525 [Alphaproteobacteria bacterium]|nr:hypothetical protein [Alphaproteobacteria bacterium]
MTRVTWVLSWLAKGLDRLKAKLDPNSERTLVTLRTPEDVSAWFDKFLEDLGL